MCTIEANLLITRVYSQDFAETATNRSCTTEAHYLIRPRPIPPSRIVCGGKVQEKAAGSFAKRPALEILAISLLGDGFGFPLPVRCPHDPPLLNPFDWFWKSLDPIVDSSCRLLACKDVVGDERRKAGEEGKRGDDRSEPPRNGELFARRCEVLT